MGNITECSESRGVFYQSLKIMRLRFIYLFVSLAYTFKRHELSLVDYMLWVIQAAVGASDVVPAMSILGRDGIDSRHGWLSFYGWMD